MAEDKPNQPEQPTPAEIFAPVPAKVGAENQPAPGAGEQAPPTKTYTEEAWGKRETEHTEALNTAKGGYEGSLAELRKTVKELKDTARTGADDAYIKAVKANDGDVAKAQAIIDREKAVASAQEELATQQATIKTAQEALEKQAFLHTASELVKELGLKDTAPLLKASNPAEMRSIALEIALKAAKTPTTPTPQTPPIGATTPSMQGVDWDKLAISDKVGMSLEDEEA